MSELSLSHRLSDMHTELSACRNIVTASFQGGMDDELVLARNALERIVGEIEEMEREAGLLETRAREPAA